MTQTIYLKQREGETITELAKRIAEAHQAARNPQPEIISLAEAKERGLKFYFTGNPCKSGNISARYVSDSKCKCSECMAINKKRNSTNYLKNRDVRLLKAAEYRSENRELIRERDKLFYQKNLQSRRENNRIKYINNKDRYLAANKDWAKKNPESIKEAKERYKKANKEKIKKSNAEYRAKNRHELKQRHKKWHDEHPGHKAFSTARRRATMKKSIPAWFAEFDEMAFREAYSLALQRQAETGIEWHVDHMVPLRAKNACGLHCADNLQVIPGAMNLEKNNKMILTEPLEWLRR